MRRQGELKRGRLPLLVTMLWIAGVLALSLYDPCGARWARIARFEATV